MESKFMDSQKINNGINDLYLKINKEYCPNSILKQFLHDICYINIDLLNKIDELERRLDERTN